jgi:hypothetical protein
MKKTLLILFAALVMVKPVFSQQNQFSFLNESEVTSFAEPLATTLGTGLNSGGFYTAHIPNTFGFSISLRAMMIFIPSDQTTFTPNLPKNYSSKEQTATFWGDKGGIYSGPDGFITYPNGLNQKSVPFAMPQITASLFGTELLLRYVPNIKVGDKEFKFFGLGVRHSISRYIPKIPVDLAIQVLYNKTSVTDVVDANTIAFNGEVSKTIGIFTAYGGLQVESSKFDLNYTIKGDPNSGDPGLREDKNVKANVKGKDTFRAIVGGALKLGFLVLNADFNITKQPVLSGGLSFQF